MGDYSDMMDMSRPKSLRPPMSMHDRAAQFSPFAALTGHSAAIAETARIASARLEPSDDDEDIERRFRTPEPYL